MNVPKNNLSVSCMMIGNGLCLMEEALLSRKVINSNMKKLPLCCGMPQLTDKNNLGDYYENINTLTF